MFMRPESQRKRPMNKVSRYLKGLKRADFDAMNADIKAKHTELAALIKTRDILADMLGIDMSPKHAPTNGVYNSKFKPTGSAIRRKALEYLCNQDFPVPGYAIMNAIGHLKGNQTFILSHPWFKKTDNGYIVTDEGRAANKRLSTLLTHA